NRSHYYLAACARAVTTVVAERGDPVGDIVVTLPQDRRRRGAAGPILMNQVTFLFYRIPAAALDSMSGTVAELAKQMMDLMRQDFPALFLRMMLLFRYLPPWLHRFLLQQPTRKRMASFFFSDTGHSLDGFTHFMGVPVLTASHIPPNMVPPGLTFIFSRCQGRLAISLGSTAEDIRSEERDRLVDQLRRELLGAPAH
ncbi:MAG: hypothetical protein O3A51_02705, partial [Verrucomicrobia bacterium]|nr:hypothetical protein [Verrucomicrobiota bacterium]